MKYSVPYIYTYSPSFSSPSSFTPLFLLYSPPSSSFTPLLPPTLPSSSYTPLLPPPSLPSFLLHSPPSSYTPLLPPPTLPSFLLHSPPSSYTPLPCPSLPSLLLHSPPSSYTGGNIASSWAVLNSMGQEGYMDVAKRLMEVTKHLKEGVNSIQVTLSA